MAQLIVRQVEDKVVRKLKMLAGLHGVSMEEEHRRILREALLGKAASRPSFKEFLSSMPSAGEAATALENDLTLVTRNIQDVKRTGVKVLNPFEPGG